MEIIISQNALEWFKESMGLKKVIKLSFLVKFMGRVRYKKTLPLVLPRIMIQLIWLFTPKRMVSIFM